MGEAVSGTTAGDVGDLALLLQAVAFSSDLSGKSRWDTLTALVGDCAARAAGKSVTGIEELEALSRAPIDEAAATDLALALLRLARTDAAFGSAFAVWRDEGGVARLANGSSGRPVDDEEGHGSPSDRAGSATAERREARSSRGWVTEVVPVTATVVTMAVAIVALKWPYFVTISIVVLVFAVSAGCYRCWQHHSWKDRSVLVPGLICAAVCAGLLASFFLGSDGSLEAVRVLPLSASMSSDFYQVYLPVVNGSGSDHQIEKVTLLVSFTGAPCAEIPLVQVFKIQNSVVLSSSRKIVKGGVSVESGPASGSSVPVVGKINNGCTLNQLQLSFKPPAAELQRRTTTYLKIDIPRKIKLGELVLPGKSPPDGETLRLPSIDNPPAVTFLAFTLIVLTDTNQQLSSCVLLTDGSPTGIRAQDVNDCNSSVFWRETFGPKSPDRGPEFKKTS